jgi:hypothetical protein
LQDSVDFELLVQVLDNLLAGRSATYKRSIFRNGESTLVFPTHRGQDASCAICAESMAMIGFVACILKRFYFLSVSLLSTGANLSDMSK